MRCILMAINRADLRASPSGALGGGADAQWNPRMAFESLVVQIDSKQAQALMSANIQTQAILPEMMHIRLIAPSPLA
jgi:hypothetical protein